MPAPPKEDVRSVAKGPLGNVFVNPGRVKMFTEITDSCDHVDLEKHQPLLGIYSRKASCVQCECHDHKLKMPHLRRLESTTFGLKPLLALAYATGFIHFQSMTSMQQKHPPGDTL